MILRKPFKDAVLESLEKSMEAFGRLIFLRQKSPEAERFFTITSWFLTSETNTQVNPCHRSKTWLSKKKIWKSDIQRS